MDYNFGSITQRVLVDKLDDDEFDVDIIHRFINDTQRDIFNKFDISIKEAIYSGTLPSTSVMFALPKDLVTPQDMIVTLSDGSSKDLMSYYMELRDFNKTFPSPESNVSGEVDYWTLYGHNMILSHPTDKDYKLNIYYYKKPTKLVTDTDIPEIPEEFEELLVLGAYIRCLKHNEDFDLADNIKNGEYAEMLMNLVDRYGFRKSGAIKMKNKQIGLRR